MSKDFIQFQQYFKEYQQRFGLTGYRTYFKHEPLDDAFAGINITHSTMVATVTMDKELSSKPEQFNDVKRNAKHEALHLLISRLEHKGASRYTTEEDIYEAAEELTNKLEELIKD